jgi:hypothetical protein
MRGLLETTLKLVEFTILEDKAFNNMALQALSICKIMKARKGRRTLRGEETSYASDLGRSDRRMCVFQLSMLKNLKICNFVASHRL